MIFFFRKPQSGEKRQHHSKGGRHSLPLAFYLFAIVIISVVSFLAQVKILLPSFGKENRDRRLLPSKSESNLNSNSNQDLKQVLTEQNKRDLRTIKKGYVNGEDDANNGRNNNNNNNKSSSNKKRRQRQEIEIELRASPVESLQYDANNGRNNNNNNNNKSSSNKKRRQRQEIEIELRASPVESLQSNKGTKSDTTVSRRGVQISLDENGSHTDTDAALLFPKRENAKFRHRWRRMGNHGKIAGLEDDEIDKGVRGEADEEHDGIRNLPGDEGRGGNLKLPAGWHKIETSSKKNKQKLPSDFVTEKNRLVIDTLGKYFDRSSLRRNETILTHDKIAPHLGVLLDAGRHYFSPEWIRRMIDVLSVMGFNLLHFRLTDDQAFNVLLESQPRLAYPSTRHNNTKVYSPAELREIVRYAKQKGIDVVPEINVPGHAGSWGGIPDLIVPCPNFICVKGYGVPLNVSNPKLRPVLKDVLTEVIDIFDNPSYLHLGGDEVTMAKPCFDEIGAEMFDYEPFETALQEILKEISYDESRVIRWETTDEDPTKKRAGDIIQFWHLSPGDKKWNMRYGKMNFTNPVFLSSGLYMDTNTEESAYDVYVKTKKLKHNLHAASPVLGIIAGTFELDSGFWFDRNVIGRLLAVSMGASGIDITDRMAFFKEYATLCRSIGLDDTVCRLYGVPPKPYNKFRRELKKIVWSDWINAICERLTQPTKVMRYKQLYYSDWEQNTDVQNNFWKTSFWNKKWDSPAAVSSSNKRLVNHTGVIMDYARYPVDDIGRTDTIIEKTMAPLGLDTIQLRLVTDISFVYNSNLVPALKYRPKNIKLPNNRRPGNVVTQNYLQALRRTAGKFGVQIMPEIAVTTNAGGWFRSPFRMKCVEFMCQHGQHIPQNVNNAKYPLYVYSIVEELLNITSSRYIHLGHDDRQTNTPCFFEATNNKVLPAFDRFERYLGNILPLLGVTSDRVVRWENREQTRYPGRFGDVTQCRSGENCRPAAAGASEPWFGTVDVREGGPFEIYSTTRRLAALGPVGIMAEIGPMYAEVYQQNQIDYRLMAFRIGTLNAPVLTKEEFQESFVRMCDNSDLEGRREACKSFALVTADSSGAIHGRDQDWNKGMINGICKDRTTFKTAYGMKEAESVATAVSMSTE